MGLPITHERARLAMAPYTEKQILEFARRGRRDPASLSSDEAMAVLAYVWAREMKKLT